MRRWSMLLLLMCMLAGCAAPSATSSRPSESEQQQPRGPRRLTAAILAAPKALNNLIDGSGAGSSPGLGEIERIYNPGLVVSDLQSNLYPILAEAVPTTENGLWRLLPDGRMETTSKIRPGAQWHDGAAFTSADVLFTSRVLQDRELGVTPNIAFESIEAVEAPDPQTVLVRWSKPYIGADGLFDTLMPSHLLEREYRENKAGFIQLPYWSTGFIGTGAYKVREFNHGINVVLDANPSFVLGRPKIEELDIRFFTDTNALVANILAGAVELTIGRNMPLDQAIVVRDQWSGGTMDPGPMKSWLAAYPQMINPTPATLLDVRMRRALMHATDRQEMMQSLVSGANAVADSMWSPGSPGFAEIDRSLMKYEFDTRKAIALLQEVGYTRGTDGAFRDASGRELVIPLQGTVGQEIQIKTVLAVADYWSRLGLKVEQDQVPAAARNDRARRSERPGFEIVRQGATPETFNSFHGSQTPLPENQLVGNNRSRYMNPQLDALIERHRVTIPVAQRLNVTREIIHHMAENLSNMGFFFDVEPMMMTNRLQNAVTGPQQGLALQQVHQWDLK
jgi:peptide/nickel transport system substrate-binding protein